MKVCTKCHIEKALELFPVATRNKDGRDSRCKACACAQAAAYRENNLEKARESQRKTAVKRKDAIRQYQRKWREENADHLLQKSRQWRATNKDSANVANREYRSRNKSKVDEYRRQYNTLKPFVAAVSANKRRARKVGEIPAWGDSNKIYAIYERAAFLTKSTGAKHEVDHIIPLKHPLVCGLHVEFNLRVVTLDVNRQKHAKFEIQEHVFPCHHSF